MIKLIVVVAAFKAKKDCEKELKELFKNAFPTVQQEEGTVRYILHRAKKDPGKFLFYEAYQDKDAFKYHSSQYILKKILIRAYELVEEEPSIEIYEKIASLER